MSFDGDIARFAVRATQRVRETFVACTEEVERSVKDGSEITGAAGQPVATGNLYGSWIPEFISDTEWRIAATGKAPDGTPVGYARHVEDNVRGVTFKNHGAHSVKDTILGWDKIQAFAAAKVNA